jgi:uncharacterized protein YkwD
MEVMKKLFTFISIVLSLTVIGLGWMFLQGNLVAPPPNLEPIQPTAPSAPSEPSTPSVPSVPNPPSAPSVPTVPNAGTPNAVPPIAVAIPDIAAPGPLRAPEGTSTASLTQEGVLVWTNAARRNNGGLKALTLNDQLNAAAEAKVRDMFSKQYFEHISPSGVGPGDLATRAGYVFISEGENLALGNFTDDQALVQAWMNSPGHRANILGKYDEIGIAVGQGTYEGATTWLAVQEFGRPVSACPQLDQTLKARVEADKASLAEVAARADALRTELNALPQPQTQEQVDAYNAKVGAYNTLVQQIHGLNQQVNGEVTVYNGQVQAYNTCSQS